MRFHPLQNESDFSSYEHLTFPSSPIDAGLRRLPPGRLVTPAPTLIGCELLKNWPVSRTPPRDSPGAPKTAAKRRDYTTFRDPVNTFPASPAKNRALRPASAHRPATPSGMPGVPRPPHRRVDSLRLLGRPPAATRDCSLPLAFGAGPRLAARTAARMPLACRLRGVYPRLRRDPAPRPNAVSEWSCPHPAPSSSSNWPRSATS